MNDSHAQQVGNSSRTRPDRRTSRACNPCRKTKTKCPGEFPRCSLCRRLNKACSYESTAANSARKHSLTTVASERSEGRILQLESQVAYLTRLVSDMSSDAKSTAVSHDEHSHDISQKTHVAVNERMNHQMGDLSQIPMEDILQIYLLRVHSQPLALFDTDRLSQDARRWPAYLTLSLYALCARFFNPLIDMSSIVEYARKGTMAACADPDSEDWLVESLGLLALVEISRSERFHASLHISMAVQICNSEILGSQTRAVRERAKVRWWNAVALNKLYNISNCSLNLSSRETSKLSYPRSPPVPNVNDEHTHANAIYNVHDNSYSHGEDIGVFGYRAELLDIWGSAMAFVKAASIGEERDFWASTSTYNKVTTQLLKFEAQAADCHRLINSAFLDGNIWIGTQAREYWLAWMMIQVLYHAAQVVINHPIIHIATRPGQTRRSSPSFQQHTVDHTYLHAKWVVQEIQMATERSIELSDPFFAHLVSVAALGLLFFVRSKDATVGEAALQDLRKCQTFIAHMATRWEHLKLMETKLQIIINSVTSAGQERQNGNSRGTMNTKLIFSMFDYNTATSEGLPADASHSDLDTRMHKTNSDEGHENLIPWGVTPPRPYINTYNKKNGAETDVPNPLDTNIFDNIEPMFATTFFGDLWFDYGGL